MDLHKAVSVCCNKYGLFSFNLKRTSCKELTKNRTQYNHKPGIYIFTRNNEVFYIGSTSDVLRRVGKENCQAQIAASECSFRFMLYLLDKICNEIKEENSIKAKERLVKNIVRNFMNKLTIYIILSDVLRERRIRTDIEECLINYLKPILQQ